MSARQPAPDRAPARAIRLRVVAAGWPARRPAGRPSGEERIPELGYFVRRCLRTWVVAGENMRSFLDRWTPLPLSIGLPAPAPGRRAVRHASARRGVAARRTARQPARPDHAAPGSAILSEGADAAALRRRFPYVAELLAELSAMSRAEATRGTGTPRA